MSERPREIKATHLARTAVVYMRQSTELQLRENVGSTDAQRSQRRYAEAWGWPDDRIEVIDDDLGLSGTSTNHRPGYQRLVRDIEADDVGAVFVSDESRLGRDMVAKLTFANLCIAKKVLLVLDGRVGDLADPTTLLQTQLSAVFSQHENLRRAEHSRRGVEARLAAGKAVSPPPAGYVRTEKGVWEKDRDPAVREALAIVFTTFRSERSYYRTVRVLLEMGIKVPRRPVGGPIRFVDPTVNILAAILKNPQYTGSYSYRRRTGDPSRGRGRNGAMLRRYASAGETVVIENHHPAYLTAEAWDEIQAILACNAPRRDRRNLGPGRALLQGIVTCERHGLAMATKYARQRDGDENCSHYYWCPGERLLGGPDCGSISGRRIDRAVTDAVLARLAPPRVAALRENLRELRRDVGGHRRLRELERRRMQRRVEDLESHLLQVDPANRLVAADLEAKLEHALRELAAAKATECQGRPSVTLAEADLEELALLASELPSLFQAPTTTNRDRKEIVRTLVRRVMIVERTREFVVATVQWNDGATPTVLHIPWDAHAHRRIAELAAASCSLTEICTRLGEEQLITNRGNPWTPNSVRMVLLRNRIVSSCSDAASPVKMSTIPTGVGTKPRAGSCGQQAAQAGAPRELHQNDTTRGPG